MTKKSSDIVVKGNDLFDYIKRKIKEGNARRLIVKNSSGTKVLEIPLTAGAAIGAILLIKVPVLFIVASAAAVISEFRVEIIRNDAE